jgi:hypothetical protein
MGITELLFLISENGASNFTFTLDMGFMNTLFLIAGGLGLILYFSGLKPHKK